MKHFFRGPGPQDLAASDELKALIIEAIKEHDAPITFAQFMAMALYFPKLGYYERTEFHLDKAGDFVTAPALSPLFAQTVCRQLVSVLQVLPRKNILELGAGTGQLAVAAIHHLASLNCLPDKYYIYETSHARRLQQQQLVQNKTPEFFSRFEWLSELPKNFIGVVFANEVLDALPVRRFSLHQDVFREVAVTVAYGEFVWTTTELPTRYYPGLKELATRCELPTTYQSEFSIQVPDYVQQLVASLQQGVILLADYGYHETLYYHPERTSGTMTSFYRHQTPESPLLWPGLQDITAHVNFSQVAAAAVSAGADVLGYTTQAQFLLSLGLMELAATLSSNLDEIARYKMNQSIKTMTFPTEMGETIKFIALGKNVSLDLQGFQYDRRQDL